MAKGIEDTSLYVYNRFVALNEVGGKPSQTGISISAFHSFGQHQHDTWPHAMNTTSTHDTKRSEDVRMRLMVLSEIPEEWEAAAKQWHDLNRPHATAGSDRSIPDANDEYFLYQTLVGAYPFNDSEYPEFIHRIKEYIIKAVREAKVHTAWLQPDAEYENGFTEFVDRILDRAENNVFTEKLKAFQARIAFYGALNSLSQTLLKITAPGIPDFYQGTELWNLSLVDPDNRRPVDFDHRQQTLKSIKARAASNLPTLISELCESWMDGHIKLFLIAQALSTRNQLSEVFSQGTYEPLEVIGPAQTHVITFARRHGDCTIITVATRFFTNLVEPGVFPLGPTVWQETRIEWPQDLITSPTWTNALTDETLSSTESLPLGEILRQFPVALLVNQTGE